METDTPEHDAILANRRDELDALDAQLLDTVRRRIECCVNIAVLKQENGIPMMQPGRVGVVHQRAQSYGEENGVSTEFLRALYEVIITETCRVEDRIIDGLSRASDNATSR